MGGATTNPGRTPLSSSRLEEANDLSKRTLYSSRSKVIIFALCFSECQPPVTLCRLAVSSLAIAGEGGDLWVGLDGGALLRMPPADPLPAGKTSIQLCVCKTSCACVKLLVSSSACEQFLVLLV